MNENTRNEKKRQYVRRRRYGITNEEFQMMILLREGKCDLCHKLPQGSRKTLFIDHDHITNEIRGLLCNECNLGLSYLGDDNDIPNRVQQYFNKNLRMTILPSANPNVWRTK